MALLRLVFSFILLTSLPALAPRVQGQPLLSLVEKTIAGQFPVPTLDWQDLKAGLVSSDSSRFLLFDVRTPQEYEVSHLASAIRVDPDLPAEEFIKQYGDSLPGKCVVFYCSVGYRSAQLLQRLQKVLQAARVHSAANLRGGIFRWHNEGNPVVNATGPVQAVHPYNRFWGTLIRGKRKTLPQ